MRALTPSLITCPPRRDRAGAARGLGWTIHPFGKANAFVIVTPEYKHGYPTPSKYLIDSLYDEWQAKAVAFVSYGGNRTIQGGDRMMELDAYFNHIGFDRERTPTLNVLRELHLLHTQTIPFQKSRSPVKN